MEVVRLGVVQLPLAPVLLSGLGVIAQPATCTLLVVHVNVEVWPLVMLAGDAVKLLITGSGTVAAAMVTVTLLVSFAPAALLQLSVYVFAPVAVSCPVDQLPVGVTVPAPGSIEQLVDPVEAHWNVTSWP